MKLLVPAMLAVMAFLLLSHARGDSGPYVDIPMGALPADTVKGIMQKTLSPRGRFVILVSTGNVRIFDAAQNVTQARQALEAMQAAPALVSFAIVIKTGMHKVTRVTSSAPEAEFPVPATYAPPQVVSTGRGYIVTPATPTSFTNEAVGTQTTITETSIEGGQARRYAGSTLFPKPAAVTACAKVSDPAALHDWAVRNGAVPQNEPAWPAARTEILVTPERADSGMVLSLQPQVVVAAADGSPRIIPLKTCTTSVVVRQGAWFPVDGFPGADPEFYRVFLDAAESTDDSLASIMVGAGFDYTAAAQQQQPAPPPAQQAPPPQPADSKQ